MSSLVGVVSDTHSSLSRRGLLGATSTALFGSSASSGTRTPASGVVADRENVQRAIDHATNREEFAQGSYTRVALESGATYTPQRPWHVGRGVIFDFNGAKVVPSGDHDVIHLHPEARLVRPYIDVRDHDYSATAITLDTRYGNYGGPNRSTVEGGHLLADPGNGTGIELHDRADEGIWDSQFSGLVQGFDTGILLRASGGRDAYVNSNHFDVTASAYVTAVEHRGVSGAAVNGNYFDLVAQPCRASRHLWDLGGEAAFNTMRADVWDKRLYRDRSQIIRFAGGGDNTLVDRFGYTTAAHARGAGRITSPHETGISSPNRDDGTGGNSPRADGDEKTLVVRGTGSYTVVVEGSVEVASDVERGKIVGGDVLDEEGPQAGTMSIEGEVVGGKDVYTIDGQIIRQHVHGDVQLTVERSSE